MFLFANSAMLILFLEELWNSPMILRLVRFRSLVTCDTVCGLVHAFAAKNLFNLLCLKMILDVYTLVLYPYYLVVVSFLMYQSGLILHWF